MKINIPVWAFIEADSSLKFCKISIICYNGIEYSCGLLFLGSYSSLGWAPFLVSECLVHCFYEKTAESGRKMGVRFERLCQKPRSREFFALVVSAVTSFIVVGFLQKLGLGEKAYFGFLSVLFCFVLAYLMKRRTELKLTDLFQSAFYWEYRWMNYGIQRKGIAMSDENVRDRAGLSYAHKLRNAEDHHRFWKYVKAMATSKKVPPEMFEVY